MEHNRVLYDWDIKHNVFEKINILKNILCTYTFRGEIKAPIQHKKIIIQYERLRTIAFKEFLIMKKISLNEFTEIFDKILDEYTDKEITTKEFKDKTLDFMIVVMDKCIEKPVVKGEKTTIKNLPEKEHKQWIINQ